MRVHLANHRLKRKSIDLPIMFRIVRCSAVLLQASSILLSASRSRSIATMKTVRNDGIGGKGVIHLPSSGKYSNVVVWLHGLGDTADGWASLMPELRLADTKFILPTAETRPISLNGGMPMPGMRTRNRGPNLIEPVICLMVSTIYACFYCVFRLFLQSHPASF